MRSNTRSSGRSRSQSNSAIKIKTNSGSKVSKRKIKIINGVRHPGY